MSLTRPGHDDDLKRGPLASWCHRVTTHKAFIHGVTMLIVFGAVLVGVETYGAVMAEYGGSGGRVSGPVANQIVHALADEGYL